MTAEPTDPTKTRTYRVFAWYVSFAQRHTTLLLIALLSLAGVALQLALKLELHTDMAELLPDEHPSVVALRGIAGRQKSATNLVMLVSSPDPARNRAFAEALRPELERMIPDTFTEIKWRPDTEIPEYAARWRWLYADKKDLENAEDLLDRIISERGSPLAVQLDGDPEAELKALRDQLNQKLPERKDSAYFEAEEDGLHHLGIMLWRRRDGLATRGDHETLRVVQEAVARLGPASFHPAMKVEYTGHIAQAIDEQNGIREDLTLATLVCGSLVLLSIYLYFRRLALLFVVGAPAVLGVLLSLMVASLGIHYLNVNTAFLMSIILGNGINTPIMLLARYGEERRRGHAVPEALTRAMTGTMLGTLAAMTAASIAYGSLMVTSFRGFNQFGLVGGSGMLIAWLACFVLVPPLVVLGERHFPGRLTPRDNLWRAPFVALGRLCGRHRAVPAILCLASLVLAALPLVRYLGDPLEWDFNNLRTDETPSQRLWPRMEKLGMGDVGAGYVGNNAVLLVDEPGQAEAVAEALRRQDAAKGKLHVLKTVRTVWSTLPSDQEEKLEILGRIRRKIDRHKSLMSEEEAAEAAAWRPPDELRVLTVEDLPRQIREAFTEVDGQFGRLIGVDADHETYYDWNGRDLLRMSKALTVEALGKTWTAASAATIFAGMLETIMRDGPRVTLTALIGVTTLILVLFGLRGGLPVLGCVAVGVAWLGGILGAIHLKLNFMNFVALPITLGVGADYAANIWARLRVEGTDRLADVIGDTGSAVALCSLTTIFGYSSLLMSHNRALRSFGLLADLGEVTTLVAALVAMPAIVSLFLRRSR